MPKEQWRHCAGNSNPADAPSRGQSFADFIKNKLWFFGPEWLANVESKPLIHDLSMPPECAEEVRTLTAPTHALANVESSVGVNNIINLKNYSDVDRLFRVTTKVLQFSKKLMKLFPSLSTLTAKANGYKQSKLL